MYHHETTYYLAGYYLIKLKPLYFGPDEGKIVHTCSTCINDSLLDTWAYNWGTGEEEKEAVKSKFSIKEEDLNRIEPWVNEKYSERKIGIYTVFSDVHTARQYRELFFSHLPGIQLMCIYLNEQDTTTLLNTYEPMEHLTGRTGICQNLSKRIEEPVTPDERLLGYDFIGVDLGGDFHTFYCHNITDKIISALGLPLNEYGLFEQADNWQQIHDYLNREDNKMEQVPWLVAKTKLVPVETDRKNK